MSENEMIRLLQKISEDITIAKNYLKMQALEAMPGILRNIATTCERQQMWRLADGSNSNEEIAKRVGVALRSVQYFVQEAQGSGLIIMERRGYPNRIVDIIPSEWKPWKPKSTESRESTPKTMVKEEESDVEG